MRKKRLNPEKLRVQSFQPAPEPEVPQGTVHAYATGVWGPRCPTVCPNCPGTPSIENTDTTGG